VVRKLREDYEWFLEVSKGRGIWNWQENLTDHARRQLLQSVREVLGVCNTIKEELESVISALVESSSSESKPVIQESSKAPAKFSIDHAIEVLLEEKGSLNEARWHRGGDPWGRSSYSIPEYAVAGASDTGMAHDSPAPSNTAIAELNSLRKHLREYGISSRIRHTRSGNLSMIKRWVVVSRSDFDRAKDLAKQWLADNREETWLIHDPDE